MRVGGGREGTGFIPVVFMAVAIRVEIMHVRPAPGDGSCLAWAGIGHICVLAVRLDQYHMLAASDLDDEPAAGTVIVDVGDPALGNDQVRVGRVGVGREKNLLRPY